ncbi:DUF5819 family protein [Microbacterium sp. M1A1_1b]
MSRSNLPLAVALGAWLVVTVIGQHPNRRFDRVRHVDTAALLIPNWRFFAPIPASTDFEVLHRYRVDGRVTDWTRTKAVAGRRLRDMAWFPSRRVDKGLFDVIGRFLVAAEQMPDGYEAGADYRALLGFVRRAAARQSDGHADAVQFAIVRTGGHDDAVPVEELFASRREPMIEHAPRSHGVPSAAPGQATPGSPSAEEASPEENA